jgi:hypothetical protein
MRLANLVAGSQATTHARLVRIMKLGWFALGFVNKATVTDFNSGIDLLQRAELPMVLTFKVLQELKGRQNQKATQQQKKKQRGGSPLAAQHFGGGPRPTVAVQSTPSAVRSLPGPTLPPTQSPSNSDSDAVAVPSFGSEKHVML